MSKKKNFKVIVSHPIQYHAVLWRELAKLEALNFEVYFCSDHGQKVSLDQDFGVAFKWDVPLKDGFKSKTFKNYGFGNGFFKYINLGLILSMLTDQNQVVYFHGVNSFTSYCCFWISKLKGCQTIIRNIAHLLDFNETSGFRFQLKDVIFGSVFRSATYCLYIGDHNKRFYEFFNVSGEKLEHAPHVVDNQFFQERKPTEQESDTLRKSLKIDKEEIVLLFCGKLIQKKQPKMLLNAFLKSNLNQKATLLFVGEGVLGPELKQLASSLTDNHLKQIVFLGFKNQSQLPPLYSISDVLVLPSWHQETWGLVVNEALNFSTSIIVSDNVGCGPNLVEGKTGFVFDRNNEKELQSAIERLVNSKQTLDQFKENALPLINEWSVKEYIQSIKHLVNE